MSAKVYNADEVTLMIGNVLIESGFADGEFLSYEHVSDQVTSVAGTDGEVAISRNRDPRVNITITLLQTSDGNDILSGLHALRRAPGGAFVAPFTIRDRNGRSLHEGRCWIKKPAPVRYDRSATSRQWALEGVEQYGFVGGNLEA